MADSPALPIAEYAPDLPNFPSAGSSNIRNVYPRTPISYGPVRTPMHVSSALDDRCQGAAAFVDQTRAVSLFAGDARKLYRVQAAGAYVWEDISKVGGYAIADDEHWEFDYFNGYALAANFANPVQKFRMATDAIFSDLSADAPRAKHMAVIKNAFVVLGYTYDPVDGPSPQRIWWPAAGDALSWPPPGSSLAAQLQSGFVDLWGDDGAVQSIRGGLLSADGLVFQQYGVRRMVYVGPPQIFEFLPAQNARGLPASQSPVVRGGICYFLGWDGFYACDGASVTPIGDSKVDKTFWDDLDPTYIDRVIGVGDPVTKMVWWAYPGSGNTGGVPNHLIGYNWALQRWAIVDTNVETLCSLISIGYTLDELWTVLGYTLENLPASLDSSLWAAGNLLFGMFDDQHRLCYMTGEKMAATVETSESEVAPGRRAMIRGARPLVDGTATVVPKVAIGHRERLQDSVTWTSPAALNRLGVCPMRTSGRYLRGSTTIAAGGDWEHISGIELDIAAQGRR
jgi:hypothetical protein